VRGSARFRISFTVHFSSFDALTPVTDTQEPAPAHVAGDPPSRIHGAEQVGEKSKFQKRGSRAEGLLQAQGQHDSVPLTKFAVPVYHGIENVLLIGYSVACIVENFLDLRQRDLLRVKIDVNCLRRDIHLNGAHPFQFPNSAFNGVLAMLTRNVGGDKGY
jgi:hypothetical protein